jgi:hypothetical protein
MQNYADFLPKVAKLYVGGAELEIQEYTIAKRDAVLKLIFSSLDVATLIKPFWEAARNVRAGAEIQVDMAVLVKQMRDVLARVLGSDMTTVSCLTLDTPANRKKVAVLLTKPELESLATDSKFGYSFSPMMFDWTRENLTARQEYKLFEEMFSINDFVGLVKNYVALVTETFRAAREKATTQEKTTAGNGN